MAIRSFVKYAGSALVLCALQAGAVDLSPTVDTYVHSGSPTASNGTKTVLETKTAATASRDAYLAFDLSAQSNITKVELKLYAKYNTTGSVLCAVYGVANTSWTDAMTWNTKVELGSQLATATVTNTATWITFDVTQYAMAEYNAGRKVIALGLHNPQTTSSHVTFNSKENSSNKPVLVVTTSGGGDGGTNPLKGVMDYYDGSKWVSLPIGKTGEVLSVSGTSTPQWRKEAQGSMVDFDGNVYQTVVIGNQEWTVSNIRTTHYSNGDSIGQVTDNGQWATLTTGAYCFYGNTADAVAQQKFGALYNWFAVSDPRGLAPVGWRVPTDADWLVLEKYLMGNGYKYDGTASGNLIGKSMAAGSWYADTVGGNVGNDLSVNNKSGFSALSGGHRISSGDFNKQGYQTYWWSTTEYSSSNAVFRMLAHYYSFLGRGNYGKSFGASVRLVRDLN